MLITREQARKFFGVMVGALLVTGLLASVPLAAQGKDAEVAIVSLQDKIEKVADDVGKSVVSITTMGKAEVGGEMEIPWEMLPKEWRKYMQPPEKRNNRKQGPEELVPRGLGSGVIISEDGYILTNQHVVSDAEKMEVTLSDRRKFAATLVGSDPRADLAVIKIEATKLPAARLRAVDGELKCGLFVLAIGNPFGFGADGQASVSFGIVSGTKRSLPMIGEEDRYYGNLIQTDAAINPGNSGGPLCDLDGNVIGINVAIASRSGGNQGVGFAIPLDGMALDVIGKLRKGETVEYGYLGIMITDPKEEESKAAGAEPGTGAIVKNVEPGGPAEKAGVMNADLITAIDGKAIKGADDLVTTVGHTAPGKEVTLTVYRSGKKMDIKATVARRDLGKMAGGPGKKHSGAAPAGSFEWRGLTLRDLTPALRKEAEIGDDVEGVYVDRVDEKSGAFERGLRPGMVINQVASEKVKDVAELKKVVGKIKGPVFVNIVGHGPEVVPGE